jgi:PKD repeat protein
VALFTPAVTADPMTYQFLNQSTGAIATLQWNFGDGTTSAEANPVHTYGAAGDYNVTLTATAADGVTSDTETLTITVVAPTPTPEPVDAVFTFDPNTGVPLTVAFVNQSTGPIGSYTWDFGDGTTSAEANPVHTFPGGGDYNVTLTVTSSADGTTDSAVNLVTVVAPTPTAVPVTADFVTSPVEGQPLTVQFTSSAGGPVGSYFWDFGDGTTGTEVHPTHTYPGGGDYTATLTVTSSVDGTTNSFSQGVSVIAPTPTATPEPVVAAFTVEPVEGMPLTVQFTNQSTGPVAISTWDFNDGTTSNETSPIHTFPFAGDFTVTLNVTAADNITSNSISQVVSVIAPTPTTEPVTASFTPAPVAGTPLTIQFTNQSAGPVASYTWDFNDGTTSNEANPVHTFAAAGDYNVMLTVTANDGVTTNSSAQIVSVIAPTPTTEPVDALFSAAPVAGTPLTVKFTNQSTGPVVTSTWDFGDGTSSNESNPIHTFPGVGDYTVTLTVTAADDVTTDSEAQTVTVEAAPQAAPEPLLSLNAFIGEVNDAVWNPNNTRIAAANEDGTISLWDVSTGQVANTLTGHATEVIALAWNPNGSHLASGGSDGLMLIWDLNNLQPVVTQQATDSVTAMAWSANGARLAVGSADGTITLYDTVGTATPLTPANDDAVNALAWGASDTRLLIGVDDGSIILLDLTNGLPVYTLQADDDVTSVAWSPNSQQFATGIADGTVIVWDTASGQPALPTLAEHNDAVTVVAWSPLGTQILSGSADGDIILWDATTGTTVQTFSGHTDAVTSVEWNSDGSQFLSASDDGTVLIWQP